MTKQNDYVTIQQNKMIGEVIKMKEKIAEGGIVALIVIAILILVYGISWIATCGIIKLITICFGWTFKWHIATGIWLIGLLLSSIFKSNSSK